MEFYYCRKPWRDLFEPVCSLAKKGFEMTAHTGGSVS